MYTLGLLFQAPPPLPTHYIERPKLLQEISENIFNSEIDNTVHVTVIITGMAGFGKSTLATALCYHPAIKKYFSSGFLRILLGPIPKNKIVLLSQIYRSLTGSTWTNPAANAQGAEITEDEATSCLSEELNALSKGHPRLLVIIDDVWEVKDAVDYAEIFSGCKIVVTTCRKDVALSVDHKLEICIDSMELSEAIQLLTFKVKELQLIDSATVDELNDLAMSLHKWPLLLNLVRGQLCRYCKRLPNSPLAVIKQVTKKLYENGLTVFDPKNPNRKNAAEASIRASIELLNPDDLNRMNRLVKTSIFGSATPETMLCFIWKMNAEGVNDCCYELWSAGLISFTSSLMPVDDASCVEIHLVIKQYLFDNLNRNELSQIILNWGDDFALIEEYFLQLFEKTKNHHLLSDIIQFTFYLIDTFDSTNVGFYLDTVPMFLGAMVNSLSEDILSLFRISKPAKITYMKARHKYKTILLLLKDRKYEQATACMNEVYDRYIPFYKQLSIISSFMSGVLQILEIMPQLTNLYIAIRSDLWTMAVTETVTLEKLEDTLKDFNAQLKQIWMPMVDITCNKLQELPPEIQNQSPVFQSLTDILSQLQSASNDVNIAKDFPAIFSQFSQQHNTLSDTMCNTM